MQVIRVVALVMALSACAPHPVVSTPPAACSALIPPKWAEPIQAAPVPVTEGSSLLDQVKAWAGAYLAQDGQLAKANGRAADTISIVRQCESQVNAARLH